MKLTTFKRGTLGLCVVIGLLPSICCAQIYKWVDANGQTHFSERKGVAGNAKTVELKVIAQPASAQAASSSPEYWQDREIQFKQRQADQANEKPRGPTVAKKPKSLSGGRSDDTDASRCNLARDVISGAVSHPNGKPTDRYDREIAENDIRVYCH